MGLLVIDGTTIVLRFGGCEFLKVARRDYWGMGVKSPHFFLSFLFFKKKKIINPIA